MLVLFLQLGELGLQLGLIQLGAVQLTLCVLVVQLEVLVVPQQLPVGAVQPEKRRRRVIPVTEGTVDQLGCCE